MSKWFKLIIIIEALSLFAFLLPDFSTAIFVLICLGVLLASLANLRYGLYLALLELFIGGQGYLFSLPAGGLNLSIRQAIFIIVLGVALARAFKERRLAVTESRFFFNFLLLGAVVVWGTVNAFWRGRDFASLFFDANAYFFLGYLVVFYQSTQNVILSERSESKDPTRDAMRSFASLRMTTMFSAAVAWLSFKTLAIFYLFSHNFQNITPFLYKWIRDTRVGEITPAPGGFYRVFFQSHIYLVFWLILATAFFLYKLKKEPPWRELAAPFAVFILALSAVILSFSRSFWLALSLTLPALFIFALVRLRFNLKEIFWALSHLLAAAVISFSLTAFLSYFPYPERGNFSLTNLLKERVSSLEEAALSSRWQLLPPLWRKISDNWFLGAGFGSTVTYRSLDPRVLAASPDGLYTTYAFEWGWLDVWLKLGIVGLVIYLLLFYKIFKRGWWRLKVERANPWLPLGLNFTLIALIIIHFFTPYLNHPLGLGWLMLVSYNLEPTKSR